MIRAAARAPIRGTHRMAIRAKQTWASALVATALALAGAGSASAAPTWSEMPLPLVGTQPLPLGNVADLSCWSRSRCLVLATGNTGYPNGLFVYNGDAWRHYATVCGTKVADYGRIVWAGPTEFWTITQPSSPQDGASNAGLGLCRFKDGQVVGSFSTKIVNSGDDPAGDPYRHLNSGACISATNCWFGGPAAQSPDSSRSGSFHLHWNGTELKSVYAPARRGVSAITSLGDSYFEALLAGPKPNQEVDPDLGAITDHALIHEIDSTQSDEGAFTPVPFEPVPVDPLTVHGAELLSIDNDSIEGSTPTRAWAVGGGATSGPGSFPDDPFDRGPVAATAGSDGVWTEVDVQAPEFGPDAQLIDVSAVPGTDIAYAAVMPDKTVGAMNSGKATFAKLSPSGVEEIGQFPLVGLNRGTVARIDCPAENECFAATHFGRIFRYAEPGQSPPLDDSPAFATTVTFRPNEVIEQAVSDSPPIDDSLLFAPLPTEEQAIVQPAPRRLKAAVRTVRSRLVGRRLTISFTVIRRARVHIVARKKRKIVAKASSKLLRKGRHKLVLRLHPKKWPTRMSMRVVEPGQSNGDEADDDSVAVSGRGGTSSRNQAPCAWRGASCGHR